MNMDSDHSKFNGNYGNGTHLNNQSSSHPSISSHVGVLGFNNNNYFLVHKNGEFQSPPSDLSPSNPNSVSGLSHEEDSPEEFSDATLRYISQMLMEEDMEDKICMLQDSLDLQAAEQSFYEVLGNKYPSSLEQNQSYLIRNGYSNDGNRRYGNSTFIQGNLEECASNSQGLPPYGIAQSCYCSSNSVINNVDGLIDSLSNILQVPDLSNEIQSVRQFNKGVEVASRFLPSEKEFFINLEADGLSAKEPKERTSGVEKDNGEEECSLRRSRARKSLQRDNEDNVEIERNSKQAAVFSESPLRSDVFDILLLHSEGDGKKHLSLYRQTFRNNTSNSIIQNGQTPKGLKKRGKGRGRKQSVKKDVVDLRTLLINCAQAVAADDHKSALELLKLVRQHCSPFGDGNQRLAHCFANGLEARLAGTGSQIYRGIISKRTSASDTLKAYYLYLAACPFRKMTSYVLTKTVIKAAAKATRIHIIDFGILYGFQWPTLIQRISWRIGGPPKIRITGIEYPQPGFRPAERVEETGRRLAAYAESFNVPFEYNGIAKKWETIKLEELKIDKDEILIVSCLYRAKNLHDESVLAESPRNTVLELIRKSNADIFIHGIINGTYNAPFFVTRFREALFHFSALFDMLETIVPRENWERMLIEKEIFGREALNAIACEGWERVERPETYKQWQIRIMRSGFEQISFDRNIMKIAKEKVEMDYHKDFVIDEHSRWLLQGWKGRIIYALSAWRPA